MFNKSEFQEFIIQNILPECPTLKEVVFSDSPQNIRYEFSRRITLYSRTRMG